MKRAIFVALGIGAIITSAAAFGIAGSEGRSPVGRAEYDSTLRSIGAARVAGLERCDAAAAFEREFCRIEVEAEQSVRTADLEAAYRRNHQATRAAQRARIDARYQVERAKCGALGGLKRDTCLVRAHATKGRALIEAAAPYELRF